MVGDYRRLLTERCLWCRLNQFQNKNRDWSTQIGCLWNQIKKLLEPGSSIGRLELDSLVRNFRLKQN